MSIYCAVQNNIKKSQSKTGGDQIRNILSVIQVMFNISFEQTWIKGLTNLFKNKSEMATFWDYFTQASNFTTNYTKMEAQEDNGYAQDVFAECGIEIDTSDLRQLQCGQLQQKQVIIDYYRTFEEPDAPKQQEYQLTSHSDWLIAIKSIITQNPYVNLEQISLQIKKISKKQTLKVKQIQDMLTLMNFVQKKLQKVSIQRNSLQNLQNRYKYCLEYYRLTKTNTKIYFLDACKFDMNLAPEFIWAKKNQNIVEKVNEQYIELLANISNGQIICYQVCQKHKNQEIDRFTNIFNIFSKISEQDKEENIAIIVNSCNIAISKRLKKLLIANKSRLFILPPLSPQLNPVDMFFKQLKAKIRTTTNIINLDQLQKCLSQICNNCTPEAYIEQMNAYIIKGLIRSLF